MKNLKKLLALLLALTMLLSLAACGAKEEQPAEEPEETAQEVPTEPEEPVMTAEHLIEAMETAGDVSLTKSVMELEMVISVSMEDTTMEMSLGIVTEETSSADSEDSYTLTTTTSNILGETSTEVVHAYTRDEGEAVICYSNVEGTNKWTAETVETEEEELTDWKPENAVLDQETQTVNGREAYVLRADLPGEMISLGELVDGGDAMTVLAVLYVDAETYLPLQIEVDLSDLGEEIVASMGLIGEDMAGAELTIDLLRAEMHDLGFDPVEVPAVPESGVMIANQTTFNPDQGDGTYIIQESGSAVQIACPEGWTAGEMGYDNVTLTSANGGQSVLYMMYTNINSMGFYVTVERYRAIPLMEEDNYAAHGHGPMIGDYETAWVQRNDGGYQYYAWRAVGENAIMIEMEDLSGQSIENALTPVLDIIADYDLFA